MSNVPLWLKIVYGFVAFNAFLGILAYFNIRPKTFKNALGSLLRVYQTFALELWTAFTSPNWERKTIFLIEVIATCVVTGLLATPMLIAGHYLFDLPFATSWQFILPPAFATGFALWSFAIRGNLIASRKN